jgi:xanthine dehydrogenase accessory factor
MGAVIRRAGSAPRSLGARMLLCADGGLRGTVGGGSLEGACINKAKDLFAGDASAETRFDLSATEAASQGMLCGGQVSVLLHRIDPGSLPLFEKLRQRLVQGEKPVLLTILPPPGLPAEIISLTSLDTCSLPDAVREKIFQPGLRGPFLLTHEDQEIFVDPLLDPGTLHLAGAGHVAVATARLAAFAGFEVVVMDDRQEFANSHRFPKARKIRVLDSFENCLRSIRPDDYIVIVTRGHMHDRVVLAQALRTPARYIGMIGSGRKRDAIYSSLRGDGFTDADFKRVHCPVGLAIGAETPEEIAVSIIAQLIPVRAGIAQ